MRRYREQSNTHPRFQIKRIDISYREHKVRGSLNDISAEWLAAVVRRTFRRTDAVVSGFEIRVKRDLPYSTVARFRVRYAGSNVKLPDSFFLKLIPGAATDSHTKDIGKREVGFYRRLAPDMSCLPLVRCFDAVYSKPSGRGHLLLEDLSEALAQMPQNTAPSEPASRSAIKALARTHAAWWSDPRLGTEVGQLFDSTTLANFVENLEKSVADFVRNSGIDLTSEQKEAYRSMLLNAAGIRILQTPPLPRPCKLTRSTGPQLPTLQCSGWRDRPRLSPRYSTHPGSSGARLSLAPAQSRRLEPSIDPADGNSVEVSTHPGRQSASPDYL